MSWIDSLFLGVLQAITEFLPISSSGHLVLGKNILNLSTPGTIMEVVLHMGTLLSILIYYWKDIVALSVQVFSKETNEGRNFVLLIVIASIPAVIVGFGFESQIDVLYHNPKYLWVVSLALVSTGMVLFFTKYLNTKHHHNIKPWSAFLIGIAQALAILPGISRSGMTISTGLYLGVDRKQAARFSFLMAIPVLFGAGILKFKDLSGLLGESSPFAILVGFLASAAVGVIMVTWLVKLLSKQKFWMFAVYCWVVGILSLVV